MANEPIGLEEAKKKFNGRFIDAINGSFGCVEIPNGVDKGYEIIDVTRVSYPVSQLPQVTCLWGIVKKYSIQKVIHYQKGTILNKKVRSTNANAYPKEGMTGNDGWYEYSGIS